MYADQPALNDLIPVVILLVGIAILLLFIYRFLRRRKKRHAERYDRDIEQFKRALAENNVEQINFYGDHIIWNEHLKQEDKRMLYDSLAPIQEQLPELKQLWKDVHYKIHGYEPYDVPEDNFTSRWNTPRDTIIDSPEDLLDQ